eukprot:gene3291-3745_t
MLPVERFQDYVLKNSLLSKQSRVLLAVSGGKDSVLMSHLFKRAGYHFGIAHCNFNLRKEESERDEAFVRRLAATLEVPFYLSSFETAAYAAAQKVSTQMAARTLRYEWFENCRQQEGYDLIAVAHHQNDALETVLLNLTRGTGIAGLHGIRPRRDKLIRPILFLSAAEIEEIIRSEDFSYVEDSSNHADKYARNKIRLKVIPQLKAINPGLEQTFEHNIRRFAETEQVLNQVVQALRETLLQERGGHVFISLDKIRALDPRQLLFAELIKPYGFSENQAMDILQSLNGQSGASFYADTYRITLDREELIVSAILPRDYGGVNIHPEDQQVSMGKYQIEISGSTAVRFEKVKEKAFIDAGKLIYPLILRNWEQGDHFMPLGMNRYKKLSDFFIDEKVPLPLKEQIPVLINGNGEIVWIAGWRQDNRYKVSPATKKVAIFELKMNPR